LLFVQGRNVVTVSTPQLGSLVNRVNTSDQAAPWTFGLVALMQSLARRGLLK
jgi:fumarylacetoacetate (FAA) hydrolase family protein